MNKMIKRFTALVLSLVMILCALPAISHASGNTISFTLYLPLVPGFKASNIALGADDAWGFNVRSKEVYDCSGTTPKLMVDERLEENKVYRCVFEIETFSGSFSDDDTVVVHDNFINKDYIMTSTTGVSASKVGTEMNGSTRMACFEFTASGDALIVNFEQQKKFTTYDITDNKITIIENGMPITNYSVEYFDSQDWTTEPFIGSNEYIHARVLINQGDYIGTYNPGCVIIDDAYNGYFNTSARENKYGYFVNESNQLEIYNDIGWDNCELSISSNEVLFKGYDLGENFENISFNLSEHVTSAVAIDLLEYGTYTDTNDYDFYEYKPSTDKRELGCKTYGLVVKMTLDDSYKDKYKYNSDFIFNGTNLSWLNVVDNTSSVSLKPTEDNVVYKLCPFTITRNHPVEITTSSNIENGRVFVDRNEAELDEEIYIAALPEPGYILDYYTINGQKLIANHFNYSTPGDVEVGAVFVKSNMTLNDYDKFKIDNVADSLNLDREKLEGFIKSLPKIYSLTDDECNIKDLYLNQTKLLLDFIRPVYTKLYSLPYENGEYTPDAPDSMIDYATCLGDDDMGCVLTDEEYAEYIKEITGYLILSYISVYNKAHEGNVSVLQNIYDVTFDNEFDPYNSLHVLNTMCYINNLILDTFYEHYANFLEASYQDLQSWHGTISEYDEFNECLERTASLNYIGTIDSDYDMGDFDDYTRYSIYVEEFIDCMLRMDFSDDDLMRLNIEIAKEAEESYNEWVNSNLTFDEVFDLQNRKLKYIDDEIAKLQNLLEQESLAEEYTQEIDDIRIELAKKEVRILVKVLCDLTVLSESEFAEGTSNDLQSLMVYDHDDIAEIMTKILGISSYPKSVIAIHSQHVLNDFANKGLYNNKDYAHEIINTYIGLSNKEEIKTHFNSLKNKIKSDITPRTSSSKTYKANDTKDTAEKISGSGKKGSKRTITPIEGKKVASVIVTDKDGNKVDVALNEDGTYSFIQPASNVDIQVIYKNREIVLNIGSTNASVDGETSNLDVAPILRNDRTMLPIRFVAENLGAKVDWDEKNPDKVIISRRDIKIEITLGSDIALVNGKEFKLDSVAFAENDRTYLPVRFISEALNAIVEWNESKPNEVKIYEQ